MIAPLREERRAPASVLLAWRRYLVAIRECDADDYEQVEELAWRQLLHELDRPGSPSRPSSIPG